MGFCAAAQFPYFVGQKNTMRLFILFLFVCLYLNAQVLPAQNTVDLYRPRNIQRAYKNETRSENGAPGLHYWQNKAEYLIKVQLDLKKRLVHGDAQIKYLNNSPDSLKIIRLKLAHDLWRKNGQRAYDLFEEDMGEGVRINGVLVDGVRQAPGQLNRANSFLTIPLDKALPAGKSIQLNVNWSYTAPSGKDVPRECVCDSSSWFVAYWYPQIAVYDDLHGWADAPYTGLQEMYNDFSDYEVHIQTPGNVMVWATGTLENAEDLFMPEYLKRYQKALNSKEVVHIFSPDDYQENREFFRPNAIHTFIYKAQNVPDFAFGLSDHYLWDATSALVDSTTGRQALVGAAYNPQSKDYYEVCSIAAKGLSLMSTYLPGYPYPYPRMTIFNGDDGMEFPMMCNDGSTFPNSPLTLTVHESSHTYFPFMMGINEQYYAWMDEGWAAFFDVMVSDSLAGKEVGRQRNYWDFAGTENDMPPMVPSRHLSNPAYRVASYNRPQAAYFNLYQMLGYKRFHHCMRTYMDRWKGKHPQPFDFFNTWNDAAGENLNWFWKPWFFDWGFPDLAVLGMQNNGGRKPQLLIENTGTMPMTVHVEVTYADGSTEIIRKSADVWKNGAKKIMLPTAGGKIVQKASLGARLIADTDPENNVWKFAAPAKGEKK